MPSDQSSQLLKYNFKFWKIFGICGGRTPSKYYKYYTFLFLFVTCYSYNTLMVLNLIYTPRNIELFLREMVYCFTEISVAAKVFMIINMRDKIMEALDIMDCDEFLGDFKIKDGILARAHVKYKLWLKWYFISASFVFSGNVFCSILINLIQGGELDLPICRYYFLSDENRQSYFIFWLIYQAFGMYVHLVYNVSIDSFISGLLYIAVAQLRILNNRLRNFKLSEEESELPKNLQDKIAIEKLYTYLRHYDTLLKYCKTIQEILGITLFIVFCVAALIICVGMCAMLLPSLKEIRVFLLIYLVTMAMQIFLPSYFGTQLTHESQELINAAYNCEWIPRSEPFKRSLRLFMSRVTTPIMITGLNMFPISLLTFISIMKSSYSFFTLIRKFQEEQK